MELKLNDAEAKIILEALRRMRKAVAFSRDYSTTDIIDEISNKIKENENHADGTQQGSIRTAVQDAGDK